MIYLNTHVTAGYEAPYVSDEQLARMTRVKIEVQIALAEQMLGHLPSDVEFTPWLGIYGQLVNNYFREYPDATIGDLNKIQEFINKDVAVH